MLVYFVNVDRDKLVTAAGGDPWQVNDSVQRGRPVEADRLRQAFFSAGRSTADAEVAFSEARKRFENAWDVDSFERQINSSPSAEQVVTSLGMLTTEFTVTAADLEAVAAALVVAQRDCAHYISLLETRLARADDELGDLLELGGGRWVTERQRSLISATIRNLDESAVEHAQVALRELVDIRNGYAARLRDAQDKLGSTRIVPALCAWATTLRPTETGPALSIPSPNDSPVSVHQWWSSLNSQEKADLTGQHAPDLGNLNGIPVEVRSELNQAVMNDDLKRVRDCASGHCVSVGQVLADPASYGLSTLDACRYTNALRTQQGLLACRQAEDEHGENPAVYLVKYLPEAFGGDGAAAVAMGNPDSAANTAVVVKGLGSGVRQGTLGNPDGRRLFHEANCADWAKDTAVVMWVGFDAPNDPADLRLYQPNLARVGGQALAADVNALAVTHQGAPTHMTVVGHSYGSTTVADAAANSSLRADDVVLVGCPGTDLAHSAADFHLAGGHLYVGDASQDEVSWFGHDTMRTPFGSVGLGADPAMAGYGSTRFKAEVVGYSPNPFYDHSHYFDEGSESLFSIGDVVSGHGDALQRDNMTARHRGEFHLPAIVEPEAARRATGGHRHGGPQR